MKIEIRTIRTVISMIVVLFIFLIQPVLAENHGSKFKDSPLDSENYNGYHEISETIEEEEKIGEQLVDNVIKSSYALGVASGISATRMALQIYDKTGVILDDEQIIKLANKLSGWIRDKIIKKE
jgi:hypothetical protein